MLVKTILLPILVVILPLQNQIMIAHNIQLIVYNIMAQLVHVLTLIAANYLLMLVALPLNFVLGPMINAKL